VEDGVETRRLDVTEESAELNIASLVFVWYVLIHAIEAVLHNNIYSVLVEVKGQCGTCNIPLVKAENAYSNDTISPCSPNTLSL
jgi:hypothetical protein